MNVTKSVTIEGYQGIPIIDGGGKGAVFNVTVSNVALFNLGIRNGTYGVYLWSSATNTTVTNNFITKNNQYGYGIYGYGIFVSSENNTVKGNNLTANYFGMSIRSSGNFLRNNNMTSNTYNFGISNFIGNDIDTTNTVDGKPIYIWINQHYREIPNAGYVAVVNSTNIVVKDLKLTNNDYGVRFINTSNSNITNVEASHNEADGVYLRNATNIRITNVHASNNTFSGISLENSTNNLIAGNIVSNNLKGIELFESRNNIFVENTIQNNSRYIWGWQGVGIQDLGGKDNRFYHNNIKNNPYQVLIFGDPSYEFWDNNAEGNYWSNHAGEDKNGDGILDTPYVLNPNNVDRYPLVKPWKSVMLFNVAKTARLNSPAISKGYNITVQSDHVIASLNFTKIGEEKYYPRRLSFNLTAGSSGFWNITIPRAWFDGPFTLWINDILRSFNQITQNATHSSLYFTYSIGKYQVKIIGIKSGTVLGDLTGDTIIDIDDVIILALRFGESLPDTNLTPKDITKYDP